jgi:hypothetical protein
VEEYAKQESNKNRRRYNQEDRAVHNPVLILRECHFDAFFLSPIIGI